MPVFARSLFCQANCILKTGTECILCKWDTQDWQESLDIFRTTSQDSTEMLDLNLIYPTVHLHSLTWENTFCCLVSLSVVLIKVTSWTFAQNPSSHVATWLYVPLAAVKHFSMQQVKTSHQNVAWQSSQTTEIFLNIQFQVPLWVELSCRFITNFVDVSTSMDLFSLNVSFNCCILQFCKLSLNNFSSF